MAFFKLRKAAGEPSAPAPAPESVDALRRRARYRLAGAALLVLAGVIGFPLVFDNQPRPIAVDIPIDIPDKAQVKPLPVASAPVEVAQAPAVEAPALVASVAPPAIAVPEPKEEVIIPASKPHPEPKPTPPKPEGNADSKGNARSAEVGTDKAADKVGDKAGRFIVQFGAYTDSARAHEARVKVEKAGMKTYAQVIDSPEGKKFRVRVGPFQQRSDAERAVEKIKKLNLPATVLEL